MASNETIPPSSPPPASPPPAPGTPPARRPWGLYALAGCLTLLATCFVIGVILLAGFGGKVAREVGSVKPDAVRQKLGEDVPLFPESKLDPVTTTTLTVAQRLANRFQKDEETELIGTAAYTTDAPPEQVLAFYACELMAHGWEEPELDEPLGEGEMYVAKACDSLWISIIPDESGSEITLSRYRCLHPVAEHSDEDELQPESEAVPAAGARP